MNLRQAFIVGLRQVAVATITALLVILLLLLFFGGQSARERDVQEQTLHANLAIACVLALPVSEMGRPADLVRQCYTFYDLEPPVVLRP